MTIMNPTIRSGRGRSALRAATLVLGAAAMFTACDTQSLLEVGEPEFASPGSLRNAKGLPTLIAGALSDMQVAYSGAGGDSYLSVVSLITDELHSSGTFTTRTATDQRDQFPTAQGNTSDGAYSSLHQARRSLRDAADAVTEFRDDPEVARTADADIAKLKSLEGFTYVALGEAFCSGIPFSETEKGAPKSPGQPLTTAQVFEEAIKRFDASLGAVANNNLARVGKARALLDLGRYSDAATAVSGVPDNFVYSIEHSANSGRQQNPIFALQANGRYSLSDQEGGNGLAFRSSGDPRVPWIEDPAGGFDKSIRLFIDRRYADFASPVPLADGIEARLIEAEAALKAGDAGTWLAKLNGLRANVQSLMNARYLRYSTFVPGPNNPQQTLPPLVDPGSADARLAMMFSERGFWLLTTGHRLGDFRRLVTQYGRSAASVYPTGAYHKSGVYGADLNFPIPFDEQNNPNYSIESCNTKAA